MPQHTCNICGLLFAQGWNSWCTDGLCNAFGKDICNEKLVKSIGDAMVAQGMDKLGYR